MPYYVYKIESFPIRRLEYLAHFDSFKAASAEAKLRRNSTPLAEGQIVKVVFAESELAAEDLLSQVRPAPPTTGEDF